MQLLNQKGLAQLINKVVDTDDEFISVLVW